MTLRQLRPEKITLQQAAEELGCSEGKIRHFESGRNLPMPDDIAKLMALYGTTEQTNELVSLATQIREAPSGQDLTRLAATPDGFRTYLGLEQGAREFTEWSVLTVPGLLQTRDYATAVMSGARHVRESEVARRVEQRMRRQGLLQRSDDPPLVTALFDEGALRREVGGVSTLREQLRHLVQVSERPNVSLRVLPFSVVVQSALYGPFIHMGFGLPNHPGYIYLEDLTGGRMIEDADVIDDYLAVVDELSAAALDEESSRTMISEIGEAL
ncbi:helix-turn-helix domain-containing protein [Saccharopolyspora phatthalungensis]|uniref:Transcriptional regulator with XRE-family HTH domain n=1 Tax=Saccharopolyspora phatthalungensis TaxID=664693 RepID=A0A840QC37_9PSEU|nr:helix-turn-helix transcriptional regulator [Saccharopolyspora phatthalungensis]MBB5157966.1 transcriptional regulator with XRE-family HTH domain [Saccharopolyspora phatthalungensis]